MFLYERSVVLCKKQENTGDYSFKVELLLDELAIEDEKHKQHRFRQNVKLNETYYFASERTS